MWDQQALQRNKIPARLRPIAEQPEWLRSGLDKPSEICFNSKSQSLAPPGNNRETPMANAHLDSLNARHAKLDASVAAETRRPKPDEARLARLKREKLRLKEEIERRH
jgi:hypothetical protein